MSKKKGLTCAPNMSLVECEMTIFRHAIEANELATKSNTMNNPTIVKIVNILERFLKKKKLICYGGTAINNILPKKLQFYDKLTEIPDYDFYSGNAVDDAIELADIYFKAGYTDVEAKAGVHFHTYKVFVNYIPIADITYIPDSIQDSIRKDSITVNGIIYAPPTFLKMNMYLELSRPAGDISRWEKVLKRLNLLNQQYTLPNSICKPVREITDMSDEQMKLTHDTIRNVAIKNSAVFFGGFSYFLYSQHLSKKKLDDNVFQIPEFDILSIHAKQLSNDISSKLIQHGIKEVRVIEHEEVGEIIPAHYEIKVKTTSVAFIYKPIACHSFNTITISIGNSRNRKKKVEVNVATIDAMLSFYLAFYYSDKPYYHQERILCMTRLLFEIENKNRTNHNGILNRFTSSCYGTQETLTDIRIHKSNKFLELRDKKGKREYDEWFLKYVPSELTRKKKFTKKKFTSTQKNKSLKQILGKSI